MTSVRGRLTAGVLAIFASSLTAACGGSPLGAAKSDPHAVVHGCQAQGFSIAFAMSELP